MSRTYTVYAYWACCFRIVGPAPGGRNRWGKMRGMQNPGFTGLGLKQRGLACGTCCILLANHDRAPASPPPRASASRRRSAKPSDSMSAIGPKPTQRQRLVSAMIDLCARVGYQSVSIAEVSSRAGVSSATFYEQFDGKEDCLLAAFSAARARVYRQMQPRSTASRGWTRVETHSKGCLAGCRPTLPPAGCCW